MCLQTLLKTTIRKGPLICRFTPILFCILYVSLISQITVQVFTNKNIKWKQQAEQK